MAGEDGFYLMHRGWQDHPVFRSETFSKRDAFVWLIEEAAFTERRVAMPEGEHTLRRGQIGHSYRFMAKAWKWEETKVRRFIASMAKAKIIDAATAAGQTVITVCNYDKYQARKGEAAAPTAAASPQDRRGSAANDKELKELKELDGGDAGASAKPEQVWDNVALADHLARIAGVRHVEPNRVVANIATVREWIDAGADPAMMEGVVISGRDSAPEGIFALKYFDTRIRKAIAQRDHPNDRTRPVDTTAIRDPLLRRYLENAGSLGQ